MSDPVEPFVAGELIVQNGKQKGSRVRLGATATMIGAAELCDIRLTGPGIADVHCLITYSPAGPALRSWSVEHTLVNGQPTAAELLKDGDELRIGPCVFQLEWNVEDFVPLTLAPAEPVVHEEPPIELWVPVPDELWEIHEQRSILHAEEAEVAAQLDERQRRLADWFEELAAARDEVRKLRAKEKAATADDRAKARHMRAQTDRLRHAARKDRLRARAVYARFLKRMKATWSAERQEIGRLWAELDAARRPFIEEVTQFRVEASEHQKRMQGAWELLTDGQRRLMVDRQQAEQTLEQREVFIGQRAIALEEREQEFVDCQASSEQRMRELCAEIARLEHRAAAGQAVVQQLEEKRATLEIVPGTTQDRVPLEIDATKSAEELLGELAVQHRDLARERADLTAARTELERRAAELYDHRAVVAEQVAAVAIVRNAWQTAECRTLEELEDVARALAARERMIEARELELTDADRVRRKRAHDLWDLRTKLEAWQASLAAHESTAAAARERTEAELAAKREHLQKWEAALATLCRKWAAARQRDIRRIRDEVMYWSESRTQHRLALADMDQQRSKLAETAARLAAQTLSVERTRQEISWDPRVERRLQVLRRRWESHFARFRKEIDARRHALAAETATADDRYRALTRLSTEARERSAAITADEQTSEARRLTRQRELDERAVVLSIAQARAERTASELAAARSHADEIAAAILGSDAPRLPSPEANPLVLAIAPRAA